MKKLINPIAAGGAPLFGDTVLTPVFADIYAAIESILYNIVSETEGVIVKGCVVTPNVSNWDCTSGIVYLNGKYMDFAGFTNQPTTTYIVPATTVNTPKTFFDGVSRNLLVTESATYQGSIPGGSQYISVASTTPRSLTNYISPQVQASLLGLTISKVNNGNFSDLNTISSDAMGIFSWPTTSNVPSGGSGSGFGTVMMSFNGNAFSQIVIGRDASGDPAMWHREGSFIAIGSTPFVRMTTLS
jgi:hypothetical protein